MPHATRDELSLYYEQAGSGDPPFVLVHGLCCDHTFLQPLFDHFGTTHAVTALDLRGCGASDRPEDGYDLRSLADDVAWLCAEVGVASPIILGHSLGGMIAIQLAARYPALPLGVVAVDPGPINPLPETVRVWQGFAAELEGPEGKAAWRAWVDAAFLPTDNVERRRSLVDRMCAVPLNVAAAGVRGIVGWNGLAALAMCKVPTLVLRSRPGGSNVPSRLLPLKPDLHFGMTVGAGHFNQLEVPEQVIPMIERFIQVAVSDARV